jgi:hypothetical protein
VVQCCYTASHYAERLYTGEVVDVDLVCRAVQAASEIRMKYSGVEINFHSAIISPECKCRLAQN